MVHSIWKLMPALLVGSVSYAQTAALPSASNAAQAQPPCPPAKPKMMEAPAIPCGLNENNHCFARGCANMYGLALEGDFLWWRSHNPGFVLAFDQKNPLFSGAFGAEGIAGSLIDLKANWKPGFRVGAGWNTSFDRWDVFFGWTWFQDRSSKHRTRDDITTATSSLGFYPLWPFQVLIGTVVTNYKTMSGGWTMHHNAWDLELGRAYYLTQKVSMRPHWGVRGSWIDQKFSASYSNPLIAGTFMAWDFHGKNDWWGIGPRIGLHAEWHVCSNWSLLGKTAASLLSGNTNVKYTTTSLNAGNTETSLDRDYSRHIYSITPNAQIFLGLNWGSSFNNEETYLGIDAGWEMNYYWDQFHMPWGINTVTPPNTVSSSAPLILEGLTVNAHFDF
jgi:hypothetical protein